MASTRGLTFTTTVWVVHRIHYYAADMRTNTHPSLATGFTDAHQTVIAVSEHSYGGAAIFMHLAQFAAGQLDQNITSISTRNTGKRTCGSNHLAATSRL